MPTEAAVNILLLPDVPVPSNNNDNDAGRGSKKLGGDFVDKIYLMAVTTAMASAKTTEMVTRFVPQPILNWLNDNAQLNFALGPGVLPVSSPIFQL